MSKLLLFEPLEIADPLRALSGAEAAPITPELSEKILSRGFYKKILVVHVKCIKEKCYKYLYSLSKREMKYGRN